MSLEPLVVEIVPDTSEFWAAWTRAQIGLGAAIQQASEAMARLTNSVPSDWFDATRSAFLAYERPVERARRLTVQRAMRARARRAARHGRSLR